MDSNKRDRTLEVFRRELKRFGGYCEICRRPRQLIGDKCAKCLKKMGLKECCICKEIKLFELDFYKKRGICKVCLKERERLKELEKDSK